MTAEKTKSSSQGQLYIEDTGQLRLVDKSAEQVVLDHSEVECFGMTFESDEARRAHFLAKLEEKLPELRKRPDFPVAEDDDILRLSDPPYYTACPNPFLAEFVERHGRPYDPSVPYHREPFAVDVSEGKTDPVYVAHSYHTKVPHKAIMRYILHYTDPGDIVFDGFAGSGMTGVAAQACAAPDASFRQSVESHMPEVEWGSRRCVLTDLSPAATFIARGYNFSPSRLTVFKHRVGQEIRGLASAHAHLYRAGNRAGAEFHYAVWTDVFACPHCGSQFSFWDAAVDQVAWTIATEFSCPSCDAALRKSGLERVSETYFDEALGTASSRGKYVLSIVNRSFEGARGLHSPSADDLELAKEVEQKKIPHWYPADPMLFNDDGPWGQMWRAGYHAGITHVHHFFTKRNMWSLAAVWERFAGLPDDLRLPAQYVFTGTLQISSRMSQFRFDSRKKGNTAGGIMKGALFVPSLSKEGAVPDLLERRFQAILNQYETQSLWRMDPSNVTIGTGSCAHVTCPPDSIDYVFIDPPFGANIMYSELSFLWEAWLRVFTRQDEEAIVCDFQKKVLPDYQGLMLVCLRECYRILKPGRWMTVEFHNSQNSVWNAIQEAIQGAGFVVADVRTLDKKQGSFKQLTTNAAVKQDLVISAYKPNQGLDERFKLEAGTEEGVWDFVRSHMRQLPVFVSKDGQAEVIAERQNYLLFDRMVAFHVQRGVTVPLSAAEFYKGLDQRFGPVRDAMYFLEEQGAEYDRKRMTVREVVQLELFVKDEETAIRWLRQRFTKKPETFQEVHPHFMKELGGWEKHERSLELAELLEQNFLLYDGAGDVPSQVHSYLSSNFRELRGLEKNEPALRAKAKDRWYVPDPRRAGDLEKLRDRALFREFDEYRGTTQKKLKGFRLEALRSGFKRAWQERDYATIIAVARKIPDKVLQEDPKLLMWFDQALTRGGDE